jgi:ribulose-5-phosphate 4-epimerase/fuculose-1-phosphate aldolase
MADVLPQEGVVKFQAAHRVRSLEERQYGELVCKLIAWREILGLTGLVGQDPGRYGGYGFGNVSARVGPPGAARGRRAFLITGTQTAGKRCVGLDDFARIERYDYYRNRVESSGRVEPSSETMTHAALYDVSPAIRCVLHAHSPVVWLRARELRIPTTDANIPYGTPEMALAVQRLCDATALPEVRILAMGGHEDGIVVFGRSPEEAGGVLLKWLSRAYEVQCAEDGLGLCRV